ncbi:MAG TPA: diguanylate cyclase [Dehalococcoidia bacterium]
MTDNPQAGSGQEGYSPDEIVQRVTRSLCALLGVSASAVALVEPDGYLRLRTYYPREIPLAGIWRVHRDESITGIAIRTRRPYVTRDILQDENQTEDLSREMGVRATLVQPLIRGDDVLGCLYAIHDRPRDWTEAEQQVVGIIADQVVAALVNADLLERERRQRAMTEVVLEVSRAVASGEPLRRVLARICRAVTAFSVAERCSIYLVDDEGKLVPAMSIGPESPELWERFQQTPRRYLLDPSNASNPVIQAIQQKEVVVWEDVARDPSFPPYWTETFGTRGLAVYPLWAGSKPIGYMAVDSLQEVRFSADEIRTIEGIGNQVALFIEAARLQEVLQERAEQDALTGLLNRRALHSRLASELAGAAAEERPLSLLMLDLDRFKQLNDAYGHAAGDQALSALAAELAGLGEGAVSGRYGGDEFVVILPGLDAEAARAVGERVRRAVHGIRLAAPDGAEAPDLSVSIGLAAYPADAGDAEELMQRADAAMYEAKRLGGDQMVASQDEHLSALGSRLTEQVSALLGALAVKDPALRTRARDVARYAVALARRAGCDAEEQQQVYLGALLRDVGMLAVPDEFLRRHGALSDAEMQVVREHVWFGARILQGMDGLASAIPTVVQHHERYDGQGYPAGLGGDEILRSARIVALADAYTAMLHGGPHRPPKAPLDARRELRRERGRQFDPELVDLFLEMVGSEPSGRRAA